MELVFATNNPDKLSEIKDLLGQEFVLKSLKEIGFDGDIPETDPTIEGNASCKAFFIYNSYMVNCFADDTGLEVEALDNEPGVYSARYAAVDGNTGFKSREELTRANIRKLLKLLEGKESRKARFRTVIALVIDGKEKIFEGVARGEIIYEERGGKGFGYDPVFVPEGGTRTFAEMSLAEKNRISHRTIAFRKLVSYLKTVK